MAPRGPPDRRWRMRAEIREYRGDDLQAVQALWREAFGGLKPEDQADAVARLIARDPGALLVAEQDGRIVGAVVAAFDGRRGHVYRLAVDPRNRRQGVGAALLARGEARLFE